MEKDDWSRLGTRKFLFFAVLMVTVLALPSFVYTGSYIIADAPAPKDGIEMPPSSDEKLSEELDKQISIFSSQVDKLLNSSNN